MYEGWESLAHTWFKNINLMFKEQNMSNILSKGQNRSVNRKARIFNRGYQQFQRFLELCLVHEKKEKKNTVVPSVTFYS